MVSMSFTKSRVFKGGVACLYLAALVVVTSHVAVQFTTTSGASRAQSPHLHARNTAVAKTKTRVMTDTATTIGSTLPLPAQDATSSIFPVLSGTFLALAVFVGPMAAMSVVFSLAIVALGGLALSGVLVALATGACIAAGGPDEIRSRIERNDKGHWASRYFGRAQVASNRAQPAS